MEKSIQKGNQILYDQIKLSFNSSIISHIYSHILISFTDFYGLLLGRYKILKNTKLIDSHSNYEQNVLSMIVDNVIFIYDKNYLTDKLNKLIERVSKKSSNGQIIGIFSARAFSYTNISLKEQEFYLKTKNYLKQEKKNLNIPLIFGSFSHNITEENGDNKVKTVNFYSRMYNFNEEK